MRAAAVDTGAIEGLYDVDRGFTFSVATQATAWQAAVLEKGENVRELIEAQLSAYELALDVATRSMPVTEAWIRRLHEELCRPQQNVRVLTPQGWQLQTLLKGEYKHQSNHVLQHDNTWFAYAPVADTPVEMHRLVEELSGSVFLAEHPVVQAAYAHHAFSRIHPFQDGNGRVARALASVFLYQAASVPLVIFSDDTPEYLRSLRAADAGDRQTFIDFILDRVNDAVQIVTGQLSAALKERVAMLGNLLSTPSGLAHVEIDLVAARLIQAVYEAADDEVKSLQLPPGVTLYTQPNDPTALPNQPAAPDGFRRILRQSNVGVYLGGNVQGAGQASVAVVIRAFVRADARPTGLFRLLADGAQPLVVNLADVNPSMRSAFQMVLRSWIRRVLDHLIGEMTSQAQKGLRDVGYLGRTEE